MFRSKTLSSFLGMALWFGGVMLVNNVVGGVVLVPSGSMEPTLQVGDYVAVNRLAYGLHLPLNPTAELARWAQPKRGDVVIFNSPAAAGAHESLFVKRVVGLPGDVISVKSHHITVNGQQLSYFEAETPEIELIGGARHPIIVGPSPLADMGPTKVPDDSVFVMGDHRDNSADSRVWGPVKLNRLRGKALGVLASLNLAHPRFFRSVG